MNGPVLIMAGGTGGHVFPALAVADELRRRAVDVSWLGTRQGLEARVVPAANFDIDWIDVRGVRGKGLWSRLTAVLGLVRAVSQALRVVARRRPAVVLGMGGFASGPGGLAAWILRRPLVVHEQNSVAGLTNRILARLANRVLCAFPGAFPGALRAEVVGNPLRTGFIEATGNAAKIDATERPPRVLVVGGSLGALALNKTVPAALAELPEAKRPNTWHQCGERHLDVTRSAYADAAVDARVEPFIDDMAAAYRWADLVICRAGALTVSEIAASGVAAVFVPYPFAVDDHQTGNARFLERAGAARVVQESDMSAASLAAVLTSLLDDTAALSDMAARSRDVAMPGATDAVTDVCMALGAVS